MGQDIVADGLNQIMNAKMIGKRKLVISRNSKVLVNVLKMMQGDGHIEYKINDDNSILVEIKKLNMCRAVKPRYYVKKDETVRYLQRFLPSRNIGVLVLSTNKGLLSHHEALEEQIGGSVLAYFY